MAYKAPIWEDGKSPAISAENLNNLSQAAEGAQVLYGNSAPTSSTEGAVGQFYLVVVADSDGNYPLYQCVAIANGSYTWRDTRRIPDSITSMLGIPAPGTINRALNVLANVGNLHVWERVQTYAEPVPEVPAGYTLGEVETDVVIASASSVSSVLPIECSSSVSVSYNGTVSLNSPENNSNQMDYWALSQQYKAWLQGKFVIFINNSYTSGYSGGEILYYPSDAVFTTVNVDGEYQLVASKLQRVIGYPYTPAIPAGTTTDYLTSTDRNAYPDQSAEGGEPEKPAHYTLGEAETVDVLSSAADYSAMVYVCDLNSIIINNDGSINTTNFSTLMGGSNSLTMAGNWTKFSTTKAYYITSGSDNVVFTDTVFTVSEENTLTYSGGKYILQGCRKLIGHAKVEAIPANTTITYLGQLGGGARIEVGSYVGTGTYGSSNPNSLTFGFEPKFVLIRGVKQSRGAALLIHGVEGSYIYWGYTNGSNYDQIFCTWNEKELSFYANNIDCYCNTQSDKYLYIAIG